MARSKKRKSTRSQSTVTHQNGNKWLGKISMFLVSSGIFVALLGVIYRYWATNVSLEFVQPIGNAYEFSLKNETPVDRTVKMFRIVPPSVQKVAYRITEDIYVNLDDQGRVILPGGNVSYIPAVEFKELDGQKIPANGSLKFRVPPLSSRSWMAPEAFIVDVRYELEPSNSVLAIFETLLDDIGMRSREQTIHYMVVENYWTVSRSDFVNDEAIRVFCRDNEAMAKSNICAPKNP
ncbi:MAG: hypothetical protein LBE24_02765 [Methylobacillus sp.]|jgi:hypothetical protein|nr:hypothetical protein [Methylobacillus sp.]